jgi:hypothetical protein
MSVNPVEPFAFELVPAFGTDVLNLADLFQ